MKKNIFTIAILLLVSVSAMAQQRVAVFDPSGNVPDFIREIVREEISVLFVNTPGYVVLERALINQVLQEDQFQASGLVDDAQVGEIGRRLGANLALVTTLTQMGSGNFHISARLIDVVSARVERQQTAQTTQGDGDLMVTVQRMVREMIGNRVVAQPAQVVASVVEPVVQQEFHGDRTVQLHFFRPRGLVGAVVTATIFLDDGQYFDLRNNRRHSVRVRPGTILINAGGAAMATSLQITVQCGQEVYILCTMQMTGLQMQVVDINAGRNRATFEGLR